MKDQNQTQNNHLNSFRIRPKIHKNKFVQVQHYQIGDIIGKGGFASVHKAIQIYTNSEVAVKIIDLVGLTERSLSHLKRQIAIHSQLAHPNIAKIYETVWTDSKVYIFMELVRGQELFEYLINNGAIQQMHAAKILDQIVDAVKYLHGLKVAHRDIKTENIIIDSEFNAKLIDFGLAKSFNSPHDDFLQTFCGSPSYVAPELYETKKYSGQAVDVWCLGVTLYTMLQASLPFDGCDAKMRQSNICNLNWFRPIHSTREACQLYRSIFRKQKSRISMKDLTNSEFFAKYNLQQQDLNKSKVFTSRNTKFQESLQLIKKTALKLDISESEVQSALKSGDIGKITCVYQLLKAKKESQNMFRKVSRSQQRTIDTMKNRKTIETPESDSKNKDLKIRPKSRHESSLLHVLPIIEDNHQGAFTPSKHTKYNDKKTLKHFHQQLNNIQIMSKDQIAKESIRMRAKKYKNIFNTDIGLKQIKPRLRDDSPDSPKRLIDCVKAYN